MRLALFLAAVVAAATPLAAQKPDPTTGAILRAAATDTTQKLASYRTTGDTMWAVIVDPRTAAAREVRLERRGGADERDDRGEYRDAEIYDATTQRFAAIGEMRRARYKHQGTMTLLTDGRVLIAGGAGDPEIFDPATGLFTLVAASNALAGNFSTATRLGNGEVLIVGGYGNGTGSRNSAWLFVP